MIEEKEMDKEAEFLKRMIEGMSKFKKQQKNKNSKKHRPEISAPIIEDEVIYGEYGPFIVLRTKDLKGHKERIMIVYKEHVHRVNWREFDGAIEFIRKYIGEL